MKRPRYPSFAEVLQRCSSDGRAMRVAGAHDALGGRLAEESGFDAVWSSSFEVSAARCLPDASLLSMTEYLEAAANIQKAVGVPLIADCDTGYGNNLNVAHMVHEYERAGITAVCIEDKIFPKLNSFAMADHSLLETSAFARKIETAKAAQERDDFFVVARTEALISGLGVDEALRRCRAYADAGADAVLIHSRRRTNEEVLEFLHSWSRAVPVVVVPTTYVDWHIDEATTAGVSVVIYANQGLRATVSALRETFRAIHKQGYTRELEPAIASVSEIFGLQRQGDWQSLE